MSCVCSANTLRLFVRSLVQVDVPASVIRAPPARSTQVKRHFPVRAIRQLHSTPRRLDETRISSSNDGPAPEAPGSQASVESVESAFAEISLESIDAIAAEVVTDTSPYTITEAERSPRPVQAGRAAETSQFDFKRPKSQRTGLDSSFSSPRTALKSSPRTDKPRWTEERKEAAKAARESWTPPAKEPWKRDRDAQERSPRTTSKTSTRTDKPRWAERKDDWTPPPREHWQIDKDAIREKFPDGWSPRRRLSPDALAGIRALHAQMPQEYNTAALASTFGVSPEDIRRILGSKWTPNSWEETDRQRRWFNRGKEIYTKHAAMGQKPPKKWRDEGIGKGKPEWLKAKQARAPLPALITTARRAPRTNFGQKADDGLSETIL